MARAGHARHGGREATPDRGDGPAARGGVTDTLTDEREALFAAARAGDPHAFAAWAGSVERPVRAAVRGFARVVDLEMVVQETLLRMWLVATRATAPLQGDHASLRLAIAVARNVAREELRRTKPDRRVAIEDVADAPELAVPPPPEPDPGLARAIRDCLDRVPDRLASALVLRLSRGPAQPDRALAAALGLKLNTFLQHIVRARRVIAECLRRKGVELAGFGS